MEAWHEMSTKHSLHKRYKHICISRQKSGIFSFQNGHSHNEDFFLLLENYLAHTFQIWHTGIH